MASSGVSSRQPARIRVRCACGKSMKAPATKVGRKVRCKACGEPVRVPDPRDDAEAPKNKKARTPKRAATPKAPDERLAKRKRVAPRAKRRRDAADGEGSEVVAPPAPAGLPLVPIAIIGGAVALLVLGTVAFFVLGSDAPSAPAVATADAPEPTPAAPETEAPADVADEPTPSGKSMAERLAEAEKAAEAPLDRPPVLPKSDPGAALKLIDRYEQSKPDDVVGLLGLYEELHGMVRQPGARAQIERRLDDLRGRAAEQVGELFDRFVERARAAAEAEDFAAARAVWDEARRALPSETTDAISDELALLEEQERLTAQLSAAFDEAQQADGATRVEALLAKLGGALHGADAVRGRPTYEKVAAAVRRMRSVVRGAAAAKARARVDAVRDSLRAAATDRAAAFREREAVAKAASEKKPIGLVGGAVVTALDETGFSLRTNDGKVAQTLRWGQRPVISMQVLERACREGNSQDRAELVEYCLEHRLFKDARRAAKRLRKRDAAAADLLPDIDALEAASRPLAGDRPRDRKKDGAAYDFSSDAQIADWEPLDPERTKIRQAGGLNVEGSRLEVALTEIGFEDGFDLEVQRWPASSGADPILEVRLDPDARGGGLAFIVYFSSDGGAVKLLRAEGEAKAKEIGDWVDARAYPIRFSVRDGKARLVVGSERSGTTVESPAFAFTRARIILGGVIRSESPPTLGVPGRPAPPAPTGWVTWRDFAITGQFRDDWLRKSLAEYGAVLRAELERATARRLATSGAAAPDVAAAPERLLPSADDALALAGMDEPTLERYRGAWRDLAEAEALVAADPSPKAIAAAAPKLVAAYRVFEELVLSRGRQAGVYYGRGRCRLLAEELEGAWADLDLAIDLDPDFAEALLTRAELRRMFGEIEEAEADLARAAELRPDDAELYRRRGMVALSREDYATAHEEIAIACGLDPSDAESRQLERSVRQVIDGPAWEQEFTHETAHFIVRTDISAERAREVGAHLERARTAYETLIGPPAPGAAAKAKKATCLVFDTDVAFYHYAGKLLFGHDDQRTTGLYTPLYKQLLFYEDKNDADGKAFREVVFHEGFHRYADEVMPGCPIWLNEGLAEVVAGELTENDGILQGRLRDAKEAFARGAAPSVRELIRLTPPQFMNENAAFHYALSWTLCRFILRASDAPADAKKALQTYLAKLRERVRPDLALTESFAGVDLSRLDAAWRRWVERTG